MTLALAPTILCSTPIHNYGARRVGYGGESVLDARSTLYIISIYHKQFFSNRHLLCQGTPPCALYIYKILMRAITLILPIIAAFEDDTTVTYYPLLAPTFNLEG